MVPPNKSDAGGSFYGRLELESREWTWEMTIARLDSLVTSVAVHGPAAKGAKWPLVLTMPIPASEETIHGKRILTPSQADDMQAGRLYLLVVSTTRYPQGEIRAQIALRRPGERGAR
ncbi:CHRD domain-containing protein [Alcaligenaceae bacterium A4P071]|nr:CHRD domain-containing protein [Alcaligenaceae bacterium A4P071]